MHYLIRINYLFWFLLIGGGVILAIACSPVSLSYRTRTPSSTLNNEEIHWHFSEEKAFNSLLQRAGCPDFQYHVWHYIYQIVSIENGSPPPYHDVKEKIIKRVQAHITKSASRVESRIIKDFAMRFVEVYAYVTEFMQKHSLEVTTQVLVQLEHQIENPQFPLFLDKLNRTFNQMNSHANQLNTHCSTTSSKPIYSPSKKRALKQIQQKVKRGHLFHKMRRVLHPVVYGARKVMSIAYQNCSVIELPLMPLGHDTQGLLQVSLHPSRRAWRQTISNLQAVSRSHYYISQLSPPSNNNCINTHTQPLLYDFGGRPATTSYSINLFKNAGSGSDFLGVDCSGFVATALASAGLRLKHNIPIHPIHVKGVTARLFKNASTYQLSCLQKQNISLHNPLQPGDIIASNEHILIVDQVGLDPFGIRSIYQQNDCSPYSIDTGRFNFSIIQSSSHNKVGINRMHITQAFDEHSLIGQGLQKVASHLCYQKFNINNNPHLSEISILRHTIHEPRCRDQEVYLTKQECLNTCEL